LLLIYVFFPFVISVENLAISICTKIFRKKKEKKKRVNEHFMVGEGSIVNLFHSFINKQTIIKNTQLPFQEETCIFYLIAEEDKAVCHSEACM